MSSFWSILTCIFIVVEISFAASIFPQRPRYGRVRSYKLDNKVMVHQYQGTTGIDVSSYIIELPNKLVIYDAQFLLPTANELLTYARYLRKPIDRVIISHSHPDHYLGSEVFKNVAPISALSATSREISQNGPNTIKRLKKLFFSDYVPNYVTIPTRIQPEGVELIDGVIFNFTLISRTESGTLLTCTLPSQRVVFVGDLVFNRVHLFLAERNFDNWIRVLRDFQRNYNSYYIFEGHGLPTTSAVFQDNINYLETTKQIYSTSATFQIFKMRMVNRFPNYEDDEILDLSQESLYPEATSNFDS